MCYYTTVQKMEFFHFANKYAKVDSPTVKKGAESFYL